MSSITWSQSVDEALCFGWIDGITRSLGEEGYCIRFTPRRPTSIWSAVNISKMKVLMAKGLVHPAGLAAFKKRTSARSKIYSYEKKAGKLAAEFEKEFRSDLKAWSFFQNQAPWYKKWAVHWIMGAKKELTRKSRLNKLMAASGKEIKL